ncbi:MAG: TlpA family protein disulfide reductase [Gammaproteobacteria bacterium]|nr:TlpA family protein disulfide reductase [Gammaproteobacteria bacterium]
MPDYRLLSLLRRIFRINIYEISRLLLLMLLIQYPIAVTAQQSGTETLELDSNTEATLTIFPADGEQLLIWIPNHAAPATAVADIASQLQQLKVEVWAIDLLEARFLPKMGSSNYKIPDSDINTLLNHAQKVRNKKIYFYTEGNAAIPVLLGLRLWQQLPQPTSSRQKTFGGVLLNSPNFYVETPDPGQAAELMPIVSATNLPVYVLQPELSPRYWQLQETVPALEKSGSDVFVQVLKNMRGRFHFRPDATGAETRFTHEFGQVIFRSMQLLNSVNAKPRVAATATLQPMNIREGKKDRYLQTYQGNTLPPPLQLPALNGATIGLGQFKEQVVLVNFWATWCPPCVHEMPSMQRLSEKLSGSPFVILGVNIAEDISTVENFLKTKINVDFPILMDVDGQALRQWNVMAFPTSFVIDKQGKIRYALFGSIDWDTEEIINKLDTLIKEK